MALLLLAGLPAGAQTGAWPSPTYVYDGSTWTPGASTAAWQANGGASFGSSSLTFGSGGSAMGKTTVSGTANDYEVAGQFSVVSGGNYTLFLRGSATTIQAGSGTYVAVAINVNTYTGNPSTAGAVIGVFKCVSGTTTNLGNVNVGVVVGSVNTMRAVVWGTTLVVYLNGQFAADIAVPAAVGTTYAGVGAYGTTPGAFTSVAIGHRDATAPIAIPSEPVASSILPTSVSLAWRNTTDDSAGIGLFLYLIYRNGSYLAECPTNEFTDATAQQNTTYSYTIYPDDQHGNLGPALTLSVTTPPAPDIDPRRIGVQKNGSYWGGGGEQIDTLSGNVNFSIPTIALQMRSGQKIPLNLSYNSQNWRQDSSYNWQLGTDTGYGFGWTLQFGSLTPYYAQLYSPPDHYVFTDSTGAQYRLDVNNNNVWSSKQSIYVWFDANANRLHFKDGSFWVMGCTSGGTEPDAGTMYPTILEDVNGNQIAIQYFAGASLPPGDYNTSSRIGQIADFTTLAFNSYPGNFTMPPSYPYYYYTFVYNSDTPVPHLTSISTPPGVPGNYGFGYSSSPLSPPFGSDSRYSLKTTTLLASTSGPLQTPHVFTYDTASAGELLKVQFPSGGCLGWGYVSFEYAGVRTMREAGSRYLDADSACSTQWNYTISRPDSPNTVTVHSAMTLVDASGVGSKTWNFTTSSSNAWQVGLLSSFVQQASAGGTILQSDAFTWSLDAANNAYISQKVTAHDPNGSNPQSAQTNQTLDQYGNATQSVVYGYNNTTTPIQTYNNAYQQTQSNGSAYVANYVLNRLVSSQLTLPGNIVKTLLTNTYDQIGVTATGASALLDTTVSSSRGLLNYSTTLASSTESTYWNTGNPYNVNNTTTGSSAGFSADAATNYAAPMTITTDSYSAQVSYNTWLGITSTTGANNEQVSMGYDSIGRPALGTSAFGGTTSYTYSASGTLPMTQTETGPNGITIATLDGLGRAVRVTRENGNGTVQSYQDTVYAPCACSPLGKIQKVSLPYAPGATKYWTTYTYDGLGRALSVQKPDGVSTTTYSYSGNLTTVTDPAGLAKTFTRNVLGNLLTVLEPDPTNQPSGTVTTSYTYDWMNHVACVDMDRGGTPGAYTYTKNGVTCTSAYANNTGTRQWRTFVYSDAGLLTSTTNPETLNAVVSYTYDSYNRLSTRTDTKGQTFVYTYDYANPTHLIEIQKYQAGQHPNGQDDACARVTYVYGANSPVSGNTYGYTYGRLASASTLQGSCYPAPSYSESYTYGAPGNVASKTVTASGATWGPNSGDTATINYGYDSYGRGTSVQYPFSAQLQNGFFYYTPVTFTTTFDTMGRPSGLTDSSSNTWVNGANTVYDYAGRLQTLNFLGVTETRGYSTVGQIASIGWSNSNYGQPAGTLTYAYPSGHNNGQISQMTDSISGETTVYQYDALKRLTSASNSAWHETFSYDGFGNLTGKTLNGNSQPISVDSTTNRLSGPSYDLNGNMTVGAGATMTYNEDNRMSSAQVASGSVEYYYYTPDGKRFCRTMANGDTQYMLYGAYGEALGTYSAQGYVAHTEMSVYFGGRRLWQGAIYSSANGSQGAVFADRLGSNRYTGNYYPYGDAAGTAPQDQVGFATYTQDSYTGLDYANQRYYASTYGRFNTTDPFSGSASPSNPSSWNRFAYTLGDPVNGNDPNGLMEEEVCAGADGDSGSCEDGGGGYDGGYDVVDFGTIDDNGNVTFTATGTETGQDPGVTTTDEDPDSDPVIDPEPDPSPTSCVAGSIGLGMTVGAGVGGTFGAVFGAVGGGVSGSVVPVAGTLGGGIVGAEVGATGGTLAGASIGGALGGLLGNIFCSAEHTNNPTPSNKPKHQKGKRRKKISRGPSTHPKFPPRTRPPGWTGPWPPAPGVTWH